MITRGEISNRNHLQTRLINASSVITADNDVILVDCTAGAVNITLPDAIGNKNLHLAIKKIDVSANAVTIATINSQLIDGASTQSIPTQWQQIEMVSDGTSWQTLSVNPADVTGFNGGTITNPLVINKASTGALVVGPNGATNPVLNVDTSVASAVTGITIQGKAAASGVVISVISSGANEALSIIAKGTSGTTITNSTGVAVALTVTPSTWTSGSNSAQIILGDGNTFIQNTYAGSLVIQTNGTSIKLVGNLNVAGTTATPAGGSTSAVLLLGTTASFGIYYGSGAPTISAAQGSIYIRSDGSSTSTRLYVNTNGATMWTNFTSAA